MTKKNKKNWVVRIMSLTLLFTLISGCLMSGTLAKYVTKGADDAKDTARVAKWGVKVTSNSGMGLFLKDYETDDGTAKAYIGGISVSSSDSDRVMAPGTEYNQKFLTIGITGTPEVASKITFNLNTKIDELTGLAPTRKYGWLAEDGTAYEPVLWSYKIPNPAYDPDDKSTTAEPQYLTGTNVSFDDMIAACKEIVVYAKPNVDLKTVFKDNAITISWKWPFETGDDAAEIAINNVKDTYLGDQAALNNPAGYNIVYDGGITVEQVD